MSFDDDDYFDLDYYDRMNHLGMYEEPEPEVDSEDELYLYGLDPNELSDMSEDKRREAIEDAGLDPDDYDDDIFSSYSGSGRSAGTHHSSSTNQFFVTRNTSSIGCGTASSYNRSTSSSYSRSTSSSYNRRRPEEYRTPNSNGKWSLLEFVIFVTILCIVGYAIKAILGELVATVVVIIIGIAVWNS